PPFRLATWGRPRCACSFRRRDLQDAPLPDRLHDLLLRAAPSAEVGEAKGILDVAELRVVRVPFVVDAAETVADEDPLRLLAPEKLREAVDQRAVRLADVLVDHDQRVLRQDRVAGEHDLGLELPAA